MIYFEATNSTIHSLLLFLLNVKLLIVKGVIYMSVRERILTIRLLDKADRHPVFAASLGIECSDKMAGPDELEEPP